jgi:hypothetical protein
MNSTDTIYKLGNGKTAYGRVDGIGFQIQWNDTFAVKVDSSGQTQGVWTFADENLEAKCSYSNDVYRAARFGRIVTVLSPEISLEVCKSEQKAIKRLNDFEKQAQQDLTLTNRRRF